MNIKAVVVGPLSTNCYIVWDDFKKGIIIDPGYDGDKIIAEVKKENLDIEYIVFTHVHFDHILAFHEVKREFGNAKLIMGEKEVPALTDPERSLIRLGRKKIDPINYDILVKNNDTVSFGNISFKVLETPGHTEGGISLYGNGHLFSGDVLFYRSIGRWDFKSGDYDTEVNTVKNILYKLPDDTIVHPGHGEETTIGFEKKYNEAVRWN